MEPTGTQFGIAEYAIYTVRDGKFLHLSVVHDAGALRRQPATSEVDMRRQPKLGAVVIGAGSQPAPQPHPV